MDKMVCLYDGEVIISKKEYVRLKKLSKTRNVYIDVLGGVATVNWDKSDDLVRVTFKDHDA